MKDTLQIYELKNPGVFEIQSYIDRNLIDGSNESFPYFSFVVLFFIILCFVFSKDIIYFIPKLFVNIFNIKNQLKLEDRQSYQRSKRNVCILAVILISISLSYSFGGNLFLFFGAVSLLILYRLLAASIIDNIFRTRKTFISINKSFLNGFIILGLIICPLLIINFKFFSNSSILLFYSIIAISFLQILVYTFSVFKILFFSKFSLISLFLYLCTIELVPIFIIYKILFNIYDC